MSVHPGGVVVADAPLERYVPLERATKGVLVTQYDMRSVAKIGLLKIDLLGNRALASLDEAAARLGGAVEADDERTWPRCARRGRWAASRSRAPRCARRFGGSRCEGDPTSSRLAIVRPGPASGEAKAAFIRRAWGEEPAVAPHARLEPLLRETYGLMLYEEDLIRVIAAMTGASIEAADDMRVRVLEIAGLAASEQDALRRAFVARAEATGVTAVDAEAVWIVLLRFAAYSFDKAHATAYADVAWRSAQMKTQHPVEFACGGLNHYGGSYPLRTVAADFARAGVRILGPDVNASAEAHDVQGGAVRVGLGAVKHLARAAAAPTPAALDGFVVRAPRGSRAPAYRALVRIKNELVHFQMHVADHPLRVLRPEATRSGAIPTGELSAHVGRRCRIAGLVAATRRVRTRAGRIMQFVTFEDEDGLVEAVLFPGVYAALADPVTNPGPFLVDGEVAEDHGDVHLVVSHLSPFHARR